MLITGLSVLDGYCYICAHLIHLTHMTNQMESKSASRIQSNYDKVGGTDGFKERAMSAAARNEGKKE
jgi:hypothetical protein